MKEIVFAGFGGQGVLTAGLVVANIAMSKGKEVSWMPAYGPSMRGGKAYSVVKYADKTIGSPNMEEIDILIAMNEPAISYKNLLKEDGLIILNSNLIKQDVEIDAKIKDIKVPCGELARKVNNPKGESMVMIGVIMKKLDIKKDVAINGIKEYFTKKGKEKYNKANIAAFMEGYNLVK